MTKCHDFLNSLNLFHIHPLHDVRHKRQYEKPHPPPR